MEEGDKGPCDCSIRFSIHFFWEYWPPFELPLECPQSFDRLVKIIILFHQPICHGYCCHFGLHVACLGFLPSVLCAVYPFMAMTPMVLFKSKMKQQGLQGLNLGCRVWPHYPKISHTIAP